MSTLSLAPAPAVLSDGAVSPGRLISVDAFRGLTIVGMILVNNPGTWSAIYPPLRHAPWHGWTPTDLIFPFFLFIVGVAIVLAYRKRLTGGADRRRLLTKAAYRSAMLFGLGLVLAAYPFVSVTPDLGWREGLEMLRIPGVLQRIALCYLAVTLLYLYTGARTQWMVGASILALYWAALMLIPVPGVGEAVLAPAEATLPAYVDRMLLGDHLWVGANREWDPEGLMSTFPAVVTTLLGVAAGRILVSERSAVERTARLLLWGVALVIGGYVWDWFFPINKQLWTSSYVLLTAGQAFCALAVCYWLIDVRGHRRWAQPFVVYGVNAITVFFMSGIIARSLNIIQVPADGGATSLKGYVFGHFFAPLGSPAFTSLLYALVWILAWYGVLYLMYRKRLFIKV